jgi:predicted  nucleic acid-binding Zn-ribbon protein
MSLSNINEIEKILLRLSRGGGDLEQRVTTLENQVNAINSTNSDQDRQITSIVQINTTQDQQLQNIQNELTNINSINNQQSNRLTNLESQVTSIINTDNQQNTRLTNLTNDFNSLDNLVRNNLEPTVSSLNSTVTGHSAQISVIQNDITNINNINNQQNTRLTNLENQVTSLQNIQILSTGTTWPNGTFVSGQWTWYKLMQFQNNGSGQNANGLRPYLLVVRNFSCNSSTIRGTALLIPEGGFNGTFAVWYFYNNTFSTAKADYNFSISSAGDQLGINFDSKPPGQAFFGDSFFMQV